MTSIIPATTSAAERPAHPPTIPVVFTGRAGEYFGIWIVNILLSIITLGIYSAWAKVRTQKYFHQHTSIDGRSFDYHATGMQILIGRAIIVAAAIAYVAVSNLAPGLSMFVFLVYFLAGPWLIVRSLRFKAVVTTWSGVRFRFEGEYGRAFKVFALYPILVAISLYLILPFLSRAIKRYIINGHSLGGSHFSFDTEIGPFYRAFLWAILGSIVCAALGFAIATIIATLAKSLPEKWLSDISRL